MSHNIKILVLAVITLLVEITSQICIIKFIIIPKFHGTNMYQSSILGITFLFALIYQITAILYSRKIK